VGDSSRRARRRTLEETATRQQLVAALEKAAETARIGSWVVELDGSRRMIWSAETHRIVGVPPDGFAGTIEEFEARVHDDDRPAVHAAIRAALEQGRAYDLEHRIVTPAGEIRWVRSCGALVCDAEGKPRRLVGAVQDIRERRQLESQLRHAQKTEAIGRLAAGVAHDLNNALTVIGAHTELALAALDCDRRGRAAVEEIRRAASRAESVTRRLLAFSRRQPLFEPRPLDLNDLVGSMAGLLSRTLGADIVLSTRLAPSLPRIVSDPGQIEGAIVNLAINAKDAMPQGGDLVLSTSLEDIDEAFASAHPPMPPGRYVVLSVADTGHGLDPETQARIFEPFFTTKPVGRGTGLGLAMVYSTMKESRGFVFVESEKGRGATFRLYFPVEVDAPALAAAPQPDSGTAETSTILVVEDNAPILELIETALAPEGYRVLSARSGSEALRVLETHGGPIGLLIADYRLPGMTGLDLAGYVQARHPGVPVVLMSGYPEAVAEFQGDRRATSILQKPFTPQELRTTVKQILDARRAAEAK